MRYYNREHECTISSGKKGNTCLAESTKKYSKLASAGSRAPEGCATSENLICLNLRITPVFWLLPGSVLELFCIIPCRDTSKMLYIGLVGAWFSNAFSNKCMNPPIFRPYNPMNTHQILKRKKRKKESSFFPQSAPLSIY